MGVVLAGGRAAQMVRGEARAQRRFVADCERQKVFGNIPVLQVLDGESQGVRVVHDVDVLWFVVDYLRKWRKYRNPPTRARIGMTRAG